MYPFVHLKSRESLKEEGFMKEICYEEYLASKKKKKIKEAFDKMLLQRDSTDC